MKWLLENGCHWDANTFRCAIKKGNIEILNWLYLKKCPWYFVDMFKYYMLLNIIS